MNPIVRRGRIENLLRRSWTGSPHASLLPLSAAYGAIADLRNVAWSLGVTLPIRAPIPIISVGGLTVGGSGKTPISAALARHLADSGSRVAVLTAVPEDEAALHARWNPDIPVLTGRRRGDLARQASDRGATVAVMDSGFQHRSLERDLDIVAISADDAGNRLRLPAGPFRERWAEIGRADAVIVVRRQAASEASAHLARALSYAFPNLHIAMVRISASSLAPVSEAAHDVKMPAPNVATAGVMWPDHFFASVRRLGLQPKHCLSLSDHAVFDEQIVARIVELAGAGGVVCTGKDAVKLSSVLPITIPLWQVIEQVEWEEGGGRLLQAAARVAGLARDPGTQLP